MNSPLKTWALLIAGVLTLGGCYDQAGHSDAPVCITQSSDPLTVSCTYTSTTTTYPTSEGGVWEHVDILHTSPEILKGLYNQGFRIIHSYICLSNYQVPSDDCPNTYTPVAQLPPGLFQALQQSLANVRAAGLKVILRFTYNNPSSENPNPIPKGGPQDAPMGIILGHMQQLAPYILANKDVISALQTGFIGEWGEWHNSTSGNDTTPQHNIFLQIFFNLFGNSQIALETRYPSDILDYLAYTHQNVPIIGIHDDALASSDTDEGTYNSHSTTPGVNYTEAQLRNFTISTGQQFTFNGETTALYPNLQNCSSFLAYAAQYHLSGLDIGFYPSVINYWQQSGCYNEVVAHVGPRLILVNATLTVANNRQTVQFAFTLKNDGFSKVMSARPTYLVIGRNLNDQDYAQVFAVNQLPDVKLNQLAAGQTTTWNETIPLKQRLEPGDYTAALWLPDVHNDLQQDPRYDLLLNDIDVANPQTGLNILTDFKLR